ncbi:MAG: GNAT family N-acetyltransferase [Phenylobacterium zucineum]|nr:MAG: GNAT family N-acetyltransferase [Phenylobacterium zucineum]
MPPTPVLETERLILRPLEARDVPAVQRIFPQWEVVRWLHGEVPWPYPEDGAATNYAQCVEQRARGDKMFWAITLKGSDDLRGRIDLWPGNDLVRDMRGFWLDPELHGQGLMMEAAEAVTGYAFEVLGWPHLWLTNAQANHGSHRIKEKQGATLVDVTPRRFVSGEAMKETWLLTREAWLARRAGG